jgi:cytochrome c oxidase subunit 1
MATIGGALGATLKGRATYTGVLGWVTTVDHKRIGVLYGITAVVWLLVGGLEALAMRLQLARPDSGLVDPAIYNQLFTMHGTTMIFLVVMPLSAAFFNFLVPLMIGARDVAFPRLNSFSYWMFLVGGLFLNSSYFLGGAPDAGWFGYANVTSAQYSPGHGIDFWVIGLALLGVSSVAAALNFIVTIINMRAPGMTLLRMPVFIWMTLVTSVLLVMAFPIITVALVMLAFDRLFGTNFFVPAAGGSVVLWQHMFWLFGHPEVYILILPAMGIVSEVLPTFSRKPLFGYYFVVFSGILIAFMGFGVWSHHMFTVGMGPAANSVFAATTMAIAVPTGVKIFNWIGTLWGGSISLKTPLLFAVGFIFLFVIGGLSGMTHAAAPSDLQQQDTYYIVAHLHYVLFGGSLFALFAGIYYWFPKFTGRILNEGLGKLHFILMFLGMNLTFGPMHNLGMDGMPRRIYTYAEGQGWDSLNLLATFGAFLMAISFLAFLHNFFYSLRKGEKASNDPWDGRTLEWSIPSPPPLYNFAKLPLVKVLDDYWRQKQEALDSGLKMKDVVYDTSRAAPHLSDAEDLEEAKKLGIHMPGTSYWPILVAVGMMIAAYGLMYSAHSVAIVAAVVGLSITIWAIYSWAFEPVADPGDHHTETDHAAHAGSGEELVH